MCVHACVCSWVCAHACVCVPMFVSVCVFVCMRAHSTCVNIYV